MYTDEATLGKQDILLSLLLLLSWVQQCSEKDQSKKSKMLERRGHPTYLMKMNFLEEFLYESSRWESVATGSY